LTQLVCMLSGHLWQSFLPESLASGRVYSVCKRCGACTRGKR
jgi:hypothetical protein